MLDLIFFFKMKVPCNCWVKYTSICLNTWKECAWHVLSSYSIHAEICTFLERMEKSGPPFLCLYSISEQRTKGYSRWVWNKLTHTFICIHSLVRTLTLWYSLSFSPSFSNTVHNPRPLCTLKRHCQFPAFFRHSGGIKEMTWLTLLGPEFRYHLCFELQHRCSKQTFRLVFVLCKK